MTDIRMTPALHAALITLRKLEIKRDEPSTGKQAVKWRQSWIDAAEVVSAVLNPEITR